MITQVVQQYKNLTTKGEKFFYYAYGKIDMKIQAVNKQLEITDTEEMKETIFDESNVNSVTITYEELKEILDIKRVDAYTLKGLKTQIKNNSSIEMTNECGDNEIIWIYNNVIFNSSKSKIEVHFNDKVIELFQQIRTMPYCNILVKDLSSLKNSYQLKLYLYSLPILRGNNGHVTKDISELRESLSESTIDDYNFYSRFIKIPAENISKNKDLTFSIKTEKEGKKIKFSVYKK